MKKLSLLLWAACAVLSVPFASAQGKPIGHKPAQSMGPLTGLTPKEQKTFLKHMEKLNSAELAVQTKYMQGLMAGRSDAAIMASMTPAQKRTLQAMGKRMTPAEMRVMMKIKANMTKR